MRVLQHRVPRRATKMNSKGSSKGAARDQLRVPLRILQGLPFGFYSNASSQGSFPRALEGILQGMDVQGIPSVFL